MLQAHEEVVSKCAECAALQAMWGGECSSLQQEVASLGQQVRGASGFRVQELGVRARGPEFKLRVEGLGVLQGRWGDECSSLQQEVFSALRVLPVIFLQFLRWLYHYHSRTAFRIRGCNAC